MNENLLWWHEQRCKKVVASLNHNGFVAIYFPNREAAFDYVIAEAKDANSIGFGGSATIQELRVEPELAKMGKELLQHNAPGLSPVEQLAIRHRQLSCDLFLTSSNAITLAGQLVNIDGVGNRVGAMTFGPKKVIVAAGRNKIVEDLDAALKRIRSVAAPANAHRLHLKLPCAVTGHCSGCDSPGCICRVTVIMDRKPSLSDIRVLIVNEEMGY